ncbi:MAG: TrkA family potassium uptake protein [Lachnospiraceae bacterium]|nr:TrkA family potassium uptake protein [Lachnospiraceae bacterium]
MAKKSVKEFVVFGLGRFGESVATTLADRGCQVMAVDSNSEKVKDIADSVTYAVTCDITDADALSSLGIGNFDGAVVAIGGDIEASVLITIMAKELGIPYVLAKARNELHAKILRKVGADMVVFPEKETGIRIANNLMDGNFFDAIELSSTFSIVEIVTPADWVGKSLIELNLRAKRKINVIGLRRNGKVNINPDAAEPLKEEDVLVMIGKNEELNKLREMS